MTNTKKLTGKVTYIGDLRHIRRKSKPDLFKRVLTIQEEDGQKSFLELRNSYLNLLEENGIKNGDKVFIEFIFMGSEKNGKRYNNLCIKNITKQ